MRKMRSCCYASRADEDDLLLRLRGRFGGKPRRRHAASPSVLRGVCPHGARLMASAVGGVCRGGGVVASLVYERGV